MPHTRGRGCLDGTDGRFSGWWCFEGSGTKVTAPYLLGKGYHVKEGNELSKEKALMFRTLERLPLHPFLFLAAAILPIYAANRDAVRIEELVLPLALGTLGICTVWFIVSLFVRGIAKGGILVSAFVVLYFSSGYFLNRVFGPDALPEYWHLPSVPTDALSQIELVGWVIRIGVMAFCACLLAVVAFYFVRGERDIRTWTLNVNAFACVLVVVPLLQIGYDTVPEPWSLAEDGKNGEDYAVQWTARNSAKRPPDIYYLILDGYGRSDVLREIYGYDNSGFLNQLRRRGFYIANRSRSNYAQTFMSLASSLNYRYLKFPRSKKKRIIMWRSKVVRSLRHSRIRKFLERRGYRTVTFSGGYNATDIADADVYRVPPVAFSEFNNALLRIIPFGTPLITGPKLPSERHRERILYTLEHLTDHVQSHCPSFEFCHICCPHPPFVFGKDGKPTRSKQAFLTFSDGSHFHHMRYAKRMEYVKKYRLQISYLNKLVLDAVDEILADSPVAPVIIIQGDHGPGSRLDWRKGAKASDLKERMTILNAYYLPGDADDLLYDTISPVNTFRVILRAYFGVPTRLLKDRSFFSTVYKPLDFVEFREDDRRE